MALIDRLVVMAWSMTVIRYLDSKALALFAKGRQEDL